MLGVGQSSCKQGPVSETLAFRRVGRKEVRKEGKIWDAWRQVLPCPANRKCGAYSEADFASIGTASLLPDPREKKHCPKNLGKRDLSLGGGGSHWHSQGLSECVPLVSEGE